jgi:chromosome segregation ATPase
MVSKKSKIAYLESQRSNLESELGFINDNLNYFESSMTKYDVQIDSLISTPSKNAQCLKDVFFLKHSREDLSERISNLYSLKSRKVNHIDEINKELKQLY